MPPKRRARQATNPAAPVPARKRTRLAASTPTATIRTTRSTNASPPVEQLAPSTRSVFSPPSSSSGDGSEDELLHPPQHTATAATPKRQPQVQARPRARLITYKKPSRRRVPMSEPVSERERDELAASDSPAVAPTRAAATHTPASRTKRLPVPQAEGEEENGEEKGEEKCEEKGGEKGEETVTPKTVARRTRPPRTAKKGTSARPRTKTHAKMGIGVPGPAHEMTPSAGRGRRMPATTNAENGADAENAAARSVATSAPAKRQISGRPSLGTAGLEDPFAVPVGTAMTTGGAPSVSIAPSTPTKGSARKVTATPRAALPPKTAAAAPENGQALEVSAESVAALQKHVMAKITGRQRLALVGVDDEYRHVPSVSLSSHLPLTPPPLHSNVHHLLEQTVAAGEGNSMLVIGARGAGKTTLVETALAALAASHAGDFHVVRLNGLLQTDDRMALREIWRQLGVEMALDDADQLKPTAAFADTLQSILAVLSHPDELLPHDEAETDAGADSNAAGVGASGAADANADDTARTATAVVFVLDEFDRFALHPRQTLLYNLFDIAQARKAPIAVLGLTCKVDVVEALEKRVKSRFSHRSVHLRLPATPDDFWAIVREGLTADLACDAALADPRTEQYFAEWNRHLDVSSLPLPPSPTRPLPSPSDPSPCSITSPPHFASRPNPATGTTPHTRADQPAATHLCLVQDGRTYLQRRHRAAGAADPASPTATEHAGAAGRAYVQPAPGAVAVRPAAGAAHRCRPS